MARNIVHQHRVPLGANVLVSYDELDTKTNVVYRHTREFLSLSLVLFVALIIASDFVRVANALSGLVVTVDEALAVVGTGVAVGVIIAKSILYGAGVRL